MPMEVKRWHRSVLFAAKEAELEGDKEASEVLRRFVMISLVMKAVFTGEMNWHFKLNYAEQLKEFNQLSAEKAKSEESKS